MIYPDDFKAEAKRLYPDWEALHLHIAQGDSIVGRYLDDSCEHGLSFAAILAATSLESLQVRARAMVWRRELYNWWARLYEEQHDGLGRPTTNTQREE